MAGQLLILLLILFMPACSIMPNTKVAMNKTSVAIFRNSLGNLVYCQTAIEAPCGLSLSNCVDGLSYLCAQDVAVYDSSRPFGDKELN